MKKRIRVLPALTALFALPFFSVTAFAVPDDDVAIDEAPYSEYYETESVPYIPPGAGTVIDYAAGDGDKVFFTIMTPDEHVFYLVIDKQRGMDNVYFLSAVTTSDLMPFAETAEPPQIGADTPPPPPLPTLPETPEPPPVQQPGIDTGTGIFIAAVVILVGCAVLYFKVHRTKRRGAGGGDEYEPYDADYDGNWDDREGGDGA